MKLDILVFAAHPDDAELSCSGTIASHIGQGYRVGIIDLTQGELGTRGSIRERAEEAMESSKVLNLAVRENLKFEDGFFKNDRAHQLQIVQKIRKYKPTVIFANAIQDRHPDHGKAAQLVKDSVFLSGLVKVLTEDGGEVQGPWRPDNVYHYIQTNYIEPDFVVDVSAFWDKKIASIKAFKTQFYNPDSTGPETFISKSGFLEFIEARAIELGHRIGAKYGEGFTVQKTVGVNDVFCLK